VRMMPDVPPPDLVTDRLRLEPLSVDHAAEMARVLADPALYTFTAGSPPSEQELRVRYARQAAGGPPEGPQRWFNWVVRRAVDGRAVGFVQATVEPSDGRLVGHVAWVIGGEHQRRGYAREAAQAMVRWLLEAGVQIVVADVHPGNEASIRVSQALGLVRTSQIVDGEVRWTSRALDM
jgi:RimJ/RimL family protein N-acetyltransferase